MKRGGRQTRRWIFQVCVEDGSGRRTELIHVDGDTQQQAEAAARAEVDRLRRQTMKVTGMRLIYHRPGDPA